MMTINEYTMNLLKESGCSLDCYKGEFGEKYALRDMQDYAKENDLRESFSFLTLIRGYCQMKKFQIEMFTRFEK